MREKITRRNALKGVATAGAVGLAGCLGGGGSGESSGRTVTHGILMPETGDLASVGRPIRDGADLPILQLQDAVSGVSFESQIGDTQTDPQAGISAAENLVNAGFPAITGPASSGVNVQVSRQVLIPNEVVGVSPSSTSPTVTGLDDDGYIFRTPPSDALQGSVMAQVGTDDVGATDAAVMYVNNDYGQALSDSFGGSFEGTVAATVAFEKEQSSYTSRLEEALADSPDMLVVIGYPASGIQIFRDYYADFDTGAQIVVTDGLRDATLPGEVGSDMSNVIGTAPSAAGPGKEFFETSFADQFGSEAGVFTSQAYDATAVSLLANVAAGENVGSAVRDNMSVVANPDGEAFGPETLAEAVEAVLAGDAINYGGASSSVDFDENGDMRAVTYEIFEFTADGVSTQSTIDFGN